MIEFLLCFILICFILVYIKVCDIHSILEYEVAVDLSRLTDTVPEDTPTQFKGRKNKDSKDTVLVLN